MHSGNRLNSALVLLIGVLLACTEARSAEPKPVKVFILVGQSNMVGQGVVDLAGKDYNDGKGTLATLLRDPDKNDRLEHLQDAAGNWRVRDDVWVRFQPEGASLRAGPLTVGYTRYDGKHHFGPELQFGHVIGDFLEDEVLLVKTAWGGKRDL